jgi:Fe-S cluster assembly protein SufD
VRNDISVLLDAEGAESRIDGLYMVDGTQHVDNHTTIEHLKPNCVSHEDYKGILGGKSHGVFSGRILVHKDAQKTDAKQNNKNLLLTRDAVINTKPQLEIYADDVKCTHGAAVGQLDENAVFYLRSRGLGESEARNILVQAFAGDIIRRIRHENVRSRLETALIEHLPVEGGGEARP